MGIFKSKRKKAEELMATGSRGAGTVVTVQDTGMTVNDNPRIKMTFRVEPLDGSPAFDTTKTTTVSRVQIPRQGDRYPQAPEGGSARPTGRRPRLFPPF